MRAESESRADVCLSASSRVLVSAAAQRRILLSPVSAQKHRFDRTTIAPTIATFAAAPLPPSDLPLLGVSASAACSARSLRIRLAITPLRACCDIWSAALTDADAARCRAVASPFAVRPRALCVRMPAQLLLLCHFVFVSLSPFRVPQPRCDHGGEEGTHWIVPLNECGLAATSSTRSAAQRTRILSHAGEGLTRSVRSTFLSQIIHPISPFNLLSRSRLDFVLQLRLLAESPSTSTLSLANELSNPK